MIKKVKDYFVTLWYKVQRIYELLLLVRSTQNELWIELDRMGKKQALMDDKINKMLVILQEAENELDSEEL